MIETKYDAKLWKDSKEGGYKVLSIRMQNHLINRVKDIATKRGFSSMSEFYRYAIRKELDYQTNLEYLPRVKNHD